jgi:hypothetical protein
LTSSAQADLINPVTGTFRGNANSVLEAFVVVNGQLIMDN